MSSRRVVRGRRTSIPIDLLLPSVVALIAILGMVTADYMSEVEIRSNPDDYNRPPPEPVYSYLEEETFSVDGYTREGTSSELVIGALPENATSIRIELAWTDDIGSNDVLRVTIMHNGTELGSTEASSGPIGVEAGENETMSGEYGGKVTAVDCPGLVTPIPVDRDNGNDWTMTVYVTIRVLEGYE